MYDDAYIISWLFLCDLEHEWLKYVIDLLHEPGFVRLTSFSSQHIALIVILALLINLFLFISFSFAF